MTALRRLPEEILLRIISCLEHDKRTLLKLALVSRQFGRLTAQVIFRHIECPADFGCAMVRDDLLERSLSANPDLRKHVRSCGPILTTPGDRDARHHVYQDYWSYAARFPNLKHMHIQCSGNLYGDEPEEVLDFFSLPQLQHVTTITLTGFPITRAIQACMSLPRVESFFVYDIQPDLFTRNSLPFESTRNLRKLELHTCGVAMRTQRAPEIDHATLAQFLSLCPSLEELHCTLPLNFTSTGGHRDPMPDLKFNAASISDALRPVQASLRFLELIIPSERVVANDNIPIDLSHLIELRHLRISSLCLFPIVVSRAERKDVCTFLPRMLETLEIECPDMVTVFCQSYRKTVILHDLNNAGIPDTYYDWFYQFPHAKKTSLPKLRGIQLKDEAPFRDKVKWEPPPEMITVFEKARITLDVRIGVNW